MKMLWLSAVTATCLLFGSVANAGDRHRDWDRHEWRDHHYDDRAYHRGWGRPAYREVYYRPAEVYYRPVYRPAPVPVPVVYEPVRGYSNGAVHGTISVGF